MWIVVKAAVGRCVSKLAEVCTMLVEIILVWERFVEVVRDEQM